MHNCIYQSKYQIFLNYTKNKFILFYLHKNLYLVLKNWLGIDGSDIMKHKGVLGHLLKPHSLVSSASRSAMQ